MARLQDTRKLADPAAGKLVGGVIEDLNAAMDSSRLSKIDNVYANLLAGSCNHLRAFAGKIESLSGQPYAAQVVEQQVVDRILAG